MEYKDDYKEYESYEDEEEGYEDEEEGCDNHKEYDKYEKKHKKLIEVDKVLGFGSAETIVEVCIPLCPPAFEVMDELIDKKVVFDALVAGKGKVFVNGRLIKDIPFKTRCETKRPGCDKISKLTFGDIRHVTAEVPFALCIDVPEARKGDKVVVLKTEVESVEIPNHTPCMKNSCIAVCEPIASRLDTCNRKLFHSITEKDCIFVKVKVVKPTIISVPCEYGHKY